MWAGVSILAVFTHYFAVFTVMPEAAWLLWASGRAAALWRRWPPSASPVSRSSRSPPPSRARARRSGSSDASMLTRAWQIAGSFRQHRQARDPVAAGVDLAPADRRGHVRDRHRCSRAPRRSLDAARPPGRAARRADGRFALAAASFAIPIAVAAGRLRFRGRAQPDRRAGPGASSPPESCSARRERRIRGDRRDGGDLRAVRGPARRCRPRPPPCSGRTGTGDASAIGSVAGEADRGRSPHSRGPALLLPRRPAMRRARDGPSGFARSSSTRPRRRHDAPPAPFRLVGKRSGPPTACG